MEDQISILSSLEVPTTMLNTEALQVIYIHFLISIWIKIALTLVKFKR